MRSANPSPRVWIAESNLQVRQTLRIFLEERLNFQVVGESDSAAGLLEQVQCAGPDLLLVAWELQGWISNRLISELHAVVPQMKVICLSSHPGAASAALAAGADAFASKADPPLRLKAAIDSVLA